MRTPIVLRWPREIRPRTDDTPVSSIDLAPTIVSAAGAGMPKGLPGLDLWSSVQTGQQIKRKGIIGESFAHDIADIENPEASLLFRWCIQGDWKLLLTYDGEANRNG